MKKTGDGCIANEKLMFYRARQKNNILCSTVLKSIYDRTRIHNYDVKISKLIYYNSIRSIIEYSKSLNLE